MSSIVASCFTFPSTIVLIVLIAKCYHFARKVFNGSMAKEDEAKWDSFTEGLGSQSIYQVMFNTFFMLRRLFLAMVLVFLKDFPITQIVLVVYSNLAMICYIVRV